jgi:hypothetical protein
MYSKKWIRLAVDGIGVSNSSDNALTGQIRIKISAKTALEDDLRGFIDGKSLMNHAA